MRWTVRAAWPIEGMLAPDFVYSSEIEMHGKDDFLKGMSVQEPWRDVRILSVLVGSAHAAVFFEGVDPSTGLAHRAAWLLEHEECRIRRLTAVHGILAAHFAVGAVVP